MSGHPEDDRTPGPDPDQPDQQEGRRYRLPGVLPEADDERRERSRIGRYAGIGLQFAVSILLFLWIGTWLDRKLGTAPLFLFLGVFLGAGGAFYGMYRSLMADLKRDEAARAARKAGSVGREP